MKILHVEDNEITRVVVQDYLALEHQWEVVSVDTAEKALEMLREKPQEYDAIISDNQLHRGAMRGSEFVKKAHTLAPNVPIVMLSRDSWSDINREGGLNLTTPAMGEVVAGWVSKDQDTEDYLAKLSEAVMVLTKQAKGMGSWRGLE